MPAVVSLNFLLVWPSARGVDLVQAARGGLLGEKKYDCDPRVSPHSTPFSITGPPFSSYLAGAYRPTRLIFRLTS